MSNFEFSFGAPGQAKPTRRNADKLRMLVISNYRGDDDKRTPLSQRQPRRVDIDTFEKLLKRWSPMATLQVQEQATSITCHQLEHFEPDSLFQRATVFDSLRQARLDILSGKTPKQPQVDEVSAEPSTTAEPVEDTFSRLLGESAKPAQKKATSGLLDSFIGKIVADEIAPSGDHKDTQIAACDAAIGELMCKVLHDPSWQRLEASWRGLYQLVSSVQADEDLSVYVMDVQIDELQSDLLDGDRQNSALVTRLVEEGVGSFGGEPWDLIVADYGFSDANAELIAALGSVAKAAGGQLLTDLGVDHLPEEASEVWQALRQSSAAKSIVLTTPRVLLRAPFGKQNEMPELFQFEECVGEPAPEDLLWGSAALLVATCLAQRFEQGESGGNLSDQDAARDRPMYVFEKDGTRAVQAVAEKLLSDRQAENLRAQWGVMPIRPQRNGNQLLFPTLQLLFAQ